MKSTQIKKLLYLTLGLAVPICALAASSHEKFAGQFGRENTEVLFGNFTCGVGFAEGDLFSYYFFEATGDILQESPYISRNTDVADPSAQSCNGLFEPASRIATAAGCTVGPESLREDSTGFSKSFQFVCHGVRSEIISVLAQLGSAQITSSI